MLTRQRSVTVEMGHRRLQVKREEAAASDCPIGSLPIGVRHGDVSTGRKAAKLATGPTFGLRQSRLI